MQRHLSHFLLLRIVYNFIFASHTVAKTEFKIKILKESVKLPMFSACTKLTEYLKGYVSVHFDTCTEERELLIGVDATKDKAFFQPM